MAAWPCGGRGRGGRGDEPRARNDGGGQIAQARGAMVAGGVHRGSLSVAVTMVDVLPAQRGPVGARLDWAWTGAWNGSGTVWNGKRPWRGRLGEVGDRAVPGCGEGDVIVGKDRGSAVGTLVELAARCVLLHCPQGATPTWPGRRCSRRSSAGPPAWPSPSPGTKATKWPTHGGFIIATGIPGYCYRPDKSWPRGSNENTDGLVRQYLPKGTDLPVHSAEISLTSRPASTTVPQAARAS